MRVFFIYGLCIPQTTAFKVRGHERSRHFQKYCPDSSHLQTYRCYLITHQMQLSKGFLSHPGLLNPVLYFTLFQLNIYCAIALPSQVNGLDVKSMQQFIYRKNVPVILVLNFYWEKSSLKYFMPGCCYFYFLSSYSLPLKDAM